MISRNLDLYILHGGGSNVQITNGPGFCGIYLANGNSSIYPVKILKNKHPIAITHARLNCTVVQPVNSITDSSGTLAPPRPPINQAQSGSCRICLLREFTRTIVCYANIGLLFLKHFGTVSVVFLCIICI